MKTSPETESKELRQALVKCEAVIGQLLESPASQSADIRAQGYTGHARESARAILAKYPA